MAKQNERKRKERDMKRVQKTLMDIVRAGGEAVRKSKKLEKMMLEGKDVAAELEALSVVKNTIKEIAAPTTAAGKVLIQANGGGFELPDESENVTVIPADPMVAQLKMSMGYSTLTHLEAAEAIAKKSN